ncbi:agouti-related protein-like isoform X1 [Scleropages formosus]|uniref:agouti-related protein-like isoform X1 n=1 Tax=Scleropages formosus TaxID=113540 RepID=UPI0008787D99|nr:agouti-related protein isoform X1 [Scleropages formosus]
MAWRTALCCVCLVQALTVTVLSALERRALPVDSCANVSLGHEQGLGRGHESTGDTAEILDKGRPKVLFARRGVRQQQRPRYTKTSGELTPARSRRCSRATESCGPTIPCCDPCSTCHCRFFNTICYCWRLGRPCPKKA